MRRLLSRRVGLFILILGLLILTNALNYGLISHYGSAECAKILYDQHKTIDKYHLVK